jgi:hypothetical protein
VRLSPLGTSATIGLLYQPQMMDEAKCESVGGKIGSGNGNTRRKPVLVPLYSPQILFDRVSNSNRRSEKPVTNRMRYGTD